MGNVILMNQSGGVSTKTIPPQGLNLTLKGGNGKIDCSFTGITSQWLYLGQYYRLIAKPGSAPTSPTDGVAVDVQVGAIGDAVISASITGLTNGVQYYVRLYVRGDNGWQTSVDAVGTATPVAGIALVDMAEGTALQLGTGNDAQMLFEILEFDHSGYPADSCAVIMKYLWYDGQWSSQSGGSNAPNWGTSNCRQYWNSTYYNQLPQIVKDNLQLVSVASTYDTSNDYIFIPSMTELGAGGSEGVRFAKFNSNANRIRKSQSNVATSYSTRSTEYSSAQSAYFTRTVYYDGSTGRSWIVIFGVSGTGTKDYNYGMCPIMSLNKNMLFNPEPNADGSYSPLVA